MSRQTLDAMMEAVEEYLPVFRKYLRKKGELLGYNNGLPWFELFAPLGKSDNEYSIPTDVQTIKTYSFENVQHLENIEIKHRN